MQQLLLVDSDQKAIKKKSRDQLQIINRNSAKFQLFHYKHFLQDQTVTDET